MSKTLFTLLIGSLLFGSIAGYAFSDNKMTPNSASPMKIKRLGIKGFERTTFWYVHPKLTDQEIEKTADAFVRSGANGVIIGGGRHHYLHDDLPYLEEQLEITRKVVKACHARGIRVCEHHSVVLVSNKEYVKEHKDWIQLDFETGDPTIQPEYQCWALCPNNPEFREHYWKVVSDFVKRTGVDALMSDDTTFHHGCCCAVCNQRWKNEVGGSLLEAYRKSRKPGSPEWRQFNEVRRRWFDDFRVWLFNRQKKEMPEIQCFSLLGSTVSPWGSTTHGGNTEGLLDTSDASWWEIYNPADFTSWRRNAAEAAVQSEAARVRGVEITTLPYADRAEQRDVCDPEEETFMWGLSRAHGLWFTQAHVYLNGLTVDDKTREYWNFEKSLPAFIERPKPAAALGICFSHFSRDNDPDWEKYHSAPALAWAQACQDECIPYRVVTDETLDQGVPGELQTLVLPDVFSLSDRHLTAIEQFVRRGGTLIASYQPACFDENGDSKLSERAKRLEQLFGVRMKSTDLKIDPSSDDQPKAIIDVTSASKMLVDVECYRHSFGRGTTIYLPALVELKAVQGNQVEGQPYVDDRDPKRVQSLAELVRQSTSKQPVIIERSDPSKHLLTTVQRAGDKLIIYMINTTGADLPKGTKVPTPSQVVWGKPIDLKLSFLKTPAKVRFYSLDSNENFVKEQPGKQFDLRSPKRIGVLVVE